MLPEMVKFVFYFFNLKGTLLFKKKEKTKKPLSASLFFVFAFEGFRVNTQITLKG